VEWRSARGRLLYALEHILIGPRICVFWICVYDRILKNTKPKYIFIFCGIMLRNFMENINENKCSICDKILKTKSSLYRHERDLHSDKQIQLGLSELRISKHR